MRDDVDALEEVVKGDDRVVQEEDRLWDPDRVRQVVARRLGLKVAHAVVAHVADRAAWVRAQEQRGSAEAVRCGGTRRPGRKASGPVRGGAPCTWMNL